MDAPASASSKINLDFEFGYSNLFKQTQKVLIQDNEGKKFFVIEIKGEKKWVPFYEPRSINPFLVNEYALVDIKKGEGLLVESLAIRVDELSKILGVSLHLASSAQQGNLSMLIDSMETMSDLKKIEEEYIKRLFAKGSKNTTYLNIKENTFHTFLDERTIKTIYEWCQANEEKNLKLLEEARKGYMLLPYIVLSSKTTGLPFNLEFRGAGDVRVRYHKNFAVGTGSVLSRHLDLYSGKVVVKCKKLIKGPAIHIEGKPKRYTVLNDYEKETKILKTITGCPNVMHRVKKSELLTKTHPIYQCEVQKAYHYFQNMNCGDVFDSFEVNRLDLKTKYKILAALCRGLHAYHEKGLIHFDIKLENCLLSEEEGETYAVIADYELSDFKKTFLAADKGTASYLSPESAYYIALKKITCRITEKIDDYALGVAAYGFLFDRLTVLASYFNNNNFDIALTDDRRLNVSKMQELLNQSFPNSLLAVFPAKLIKVLKSLMAILPQNRMSLLEAAKIFDELATE